MSEPCVYSLPVGGARGGTSPASVADLATADVPPAWGGVRATPLAATAASAAEVAAVKAAHTFSTPADVAAARKPTDADVGGGQPVAWVERGREFVEEDAGVRIIGGAYEAREAPARVAVLRRG